MQVLTCDRTCRDAHCGLTRRRPTSAAIIANAVFLLIRIIGMPRPKLILDVAIILRALIFVLDDEPDRRARRHTLEHTRENLHLVRFAALGRVPRLAGATAIEIALNIRFIKRHARRTAIDDTAQRAPMAFAEGRDYKILANTVAGHRLKVLEVVFRE